MKAVIIDDESRSRLTLRTMINRYCTELTVAGEAADIKQGHKLLENVSPDLVFLDISMPGGSGLQLLSETGPRTFEVVFVTAHNEYAIDALRNSAADYLLKPVNIGELVAAVHRVKERRNQRLPVEEKELTDESAAKKRIGIPDRHGLKFINISEIIRLEADGSYTTFFLSGGGKLVSSRHLKEFEAVLPTASFFRVHHSSIINMEYVKHYERGEGGTIIMNDNSAVALSKRKKKFFLQRFRI